MDLARFLDIYLGEGMHNVWSTYSSVKLSGSSFSINSVLSNRQTININQVFYIPAQRVLTLMNGWPRPFQGYGAQDPYVVREFSEQFRLLLDLEFSQGSSLFPQLNRMKSAYRDLFTEHIFRDFDLRVDSHGAQRRLVLSRGPDPDSSIPYMAWSAGQREFVPLLIGLYWLMPASRMQTRDDFKWVVIEEPEMGLHPAAISSVLLSVIELLSRDYKVCLSTHSPHVLDVVWALRELQKYDAAPETLLEMFQCKKTEQTKRAARRALKKVARVFYFDGSNGRVTDISSLDPGSESVIESGWGGLTEFTGRVADIVARLVSSRGSQ
jgi:hypothetical protein